MSHDPRDDAPEVGRRQFLTNAAAAAVTVVGVPSLLAACESGSPTSADAQPASGRVSPANARLGTIGIDPWIAVSRQIALTVGQASNVKVPALESNGTNSYVQKVVTDDDRTGTGLATVLRSSYKWTSASGVTTAMGVLVVNSAGTRWARRTVLKQSDLAYAMKDAFATNTLSDGVLRESLTTGRPIVAVFKSAVVQFQASASSDYYGNQLQVFSRAACDIFNPNVGGYAIASTTRDLTRC